MKKAAIIDGIKSRLSDITGFLHMIDDQAVNFRSDNKWSVGENAVHLVKSVTPINMALSLPKITFLLFGKAGNSKSYDDIVNAYTAHLSEGARASRQYEPSSDLEISAQVASERLNKHYTQLAEKLEKWSEEDLDKYRLPHPIIGKLTIREMLYFTLYHMEHHLNNMKFQANMG